MGVKVTVECTGHGRMPYRATVMLWRCETCGRELTFEDMRRLATQMKDGDTAPDLSGGTRARGNSR
jgi:hypothetical protein